MGNHDLVGERQILRIGRSGATPTAAHGRRPSGLARRSALPPRGVDVVAADEQRPVEVDFDLGWSVGVYGRQRTVGREERGARCFAMEIRRLVVVKPEQLAQPVVVGAQLLGLTSRGSEVGRELGDTTAQHQIIRCHGLPREASRSQHQAFAMMTDGHLSVVNPGGVRAWRDRS